MAGTIEMVWFNAYVKALEEPTSCRQKKHRTGRVNNNYFISEVRNTFQPILQLWSLESCQQHTENFPASQYSGFLCFKDSFMSFEQIKSNSFENSKEHRRTWCEGLLNLGNMVTTLI